METVMRLLVIAGVFAAIASSAFAQTSGYSHHTFCLIKGSSTECAYDSMAQCLQAKSANDQTCQPNSAPQNH
jgi:Protein of unknown function (DUF3551)